MTEGLSEFKLCISENGESPPLWEVTTRSGIQCDTRIDVSISQLNQVHLSQKQMPLGRQSMHSVQLMVACVISAPLSSLAWLVTAMINEMPRRPASNAARKVL